MEKDRFCCNCTFYNPNNYLCKRKDVLRLSKDWCFEFDEKTEIKEKGENKVMNLNYKNFDEAYNDFVNKKYGTNDLQEIIRIADEIRQAAEKRIDEAKRFEFDDLKTDVYNMLMKMKELSRPALTVEICDMDNTCYNFYIDDIADAIDELEY